MRTLAALLLSAICLSGCAEGLEKKIIGPWKSDMSRTTITGNAVKDDDARKTVTDVVRSITLEIKDDKSFEMKVLMVVKGKWALNGNKLLLTADTTKGDSFTFGGRNPMEFTLDPSGASMSMTSADADTGGTLTLVRADLAK